jgi:wyosine [tRNA(Phe)-imidazoG37] synthetase (radical SAM superfamily)
LDLDTVLHGILTFSDGFPGVLTTETMLVQGINDSAEELSKICKVITELDTSKSYITVPTRPPAEPWAVPASEQSIAAAYEIFTEKSISTELLTGYEGSSFAFTGNVEQDVLSITAVHPMRKEGISAFLTKAGEDWDLIEKLIKERKLVEVEYKGSYFYTRKLREVEE